MALETYTTKRDFSRTPEPRGGEGNLLKQLRFVVQRHQASKLHYDFRLEMDGVLKSWAVPRGPSMNPADKRLAVQVEDHPVSYGTFEGDIPAGNYGAGHVDIWDEGTYRVAGTTSRSESEKQLLQGLENGSVGFVLDGGKLRGGFTLVRMKGRQKGAWLLIKKDDQDASHGRYDSEEHLGEIQPGNSPVPVKAKSSRGKKEAKAGEAEMPHPVKPMMAKLAAAPFDGEDWVFETKWDGYRAIAEARAGRVELYSRSGRSYGDTYQPILDSLQKLGNEAVLDGEIVVLDNGGSPSFQQLQNYRNSPSDHLCYYAFDLLYLNGRDLRDLPLLERKQRLEELLRKELPAVRYSAHVAGRGKECFQEAQRKNMEGIMAKKADSPYRTGQRSSEWLKIKTRLRQEAVIGGFTEPKGTRKHLGALVLGVYEGNKLIHVGRGGTGFDARNLAMLKAKLDPLMREESPFAGNVNPSAPVSWVKPELVAEISFAEWTSGGMMRQAIYEGLREDKNPTDVIREIVHDTQDAVEEANRRAGNSKKAETCGTRSSTREKSRTEVGIVGKTVQLSSQDKMYWPGEGITKGDLLAYYQSISEIIMPYLVDRPQSLFRHPNGITKAGFVQKDMPHAPDWVRTVKLRAESTGEDVEYLVCDSAAVLAYMNNLGCIQLNPWNSRVTHLEKPDYMVIDLDPGENTFDEVVEVALATKEVLETVGAAAYAKTSGATGIHIFVPLGALYSFTQARQFAQLVADRVHKLLPGLTSLERNPADRRRQDYLDYLQNSLGQTVAAAYSARSRPGATVSTPLSWDEVKHGLSPHDFTLHTLPSRLKSKGDLFKAVLGKGVDLPRCVEKLGHL